MKYFYSAAVMGYGFGRNWHKKYTFPDFPRVTQTLTYNAHKGNPHTVLPIGKSVWNRVALHNMGFYEWFEKYSHMNLKNVIVSLAGTTRELTIMMHELEYCFCIGGIELNYSCPNVDTSSYRNRLPIAIERVSCPVYLKLRYNENLFDYNLNNVTGIRLNSVPFMYGGISGKMAQEKNWGFIKKYAKDFNVAGCSFTCEDDIKRLEDMGCKEIGIGSTILTNPRLIERLEDG